MDKGEKRGAPAPHGGLYCREDESVKMYYVHKCYQLQAADDPPSICHHRKVRVHGSTSRSKWERFNVGFSN